MFSKIVALLLCACGLITSCGPAYKEGETELEKAVEQMNWRITEIRNTASEYDKDAKNIYYVSVDGDDNNDGRSPETPFKTPKKANQIASDGDVVLFKRGDEWRVRWKAKSGVTYSAYGEGEKPVFNGNTYGDAADPSYWNLVDGTKNIWEYKSIIPDVGCIVFNGGESTAEKINYEIHEKKMYVWGNEFELSNKSFYANNTFVSRFVHLGANAADPVLNARLYLRCDKGNPGEVYDSIELCYRGNLISGSSNVTLDNICIKYTGSHGVGMGTVENVTIRNCEVGFIGGSIQSFQNHYFIRFGNGIEVYGGCKDFTVDNCYVYQCYDAGITHQLQLGGNNPATHENVRFTDNVIEKCIYNIEYFMGKADTPSVTRFMKDILYKGNILAYSGEGWGADPSRSASIKGWPHHNNHAENFVIEENVFILDKVNTSDLGAGKKEWLPSYKNNTYFRPAKSKFTNIGTGGSAKQYMSNDDTAQNLSEELGEVGANVILVKP